MGYEESKIEGRNAVLEAFRSGKTIDKLYVLDGCQDGPVRSITREARKHDTIINYVAKERLDQISETGKHQGVIAVSAAYEYAPLPHNQIQRQISCLYSQVYDLHPHHEPEGYEVPVWIPFDPAAFFPAGSGCQSPMEV